MNWVKTNALNLLVVILLLVVMLKPDPETTTIDVHDQNIGKIVEQKDSIDKELKSAEKRIEQIEKEKIEMLENFSAEVNYYKKLYAQDPSYSKAFIRQMIDSVKNAIETYSRENLTDDEYGILADTLQDCRKTKLELISSVKLNKELKFINKGLEDKNKLNSEQLVEVNAKYELVKPTFWTNRFVIYAGGGANYDGTKLSPGLQLGIGIRITDVDLF